MTGLTFQKELARMGVDLPVIFMMGPGDIRMSVRAMKAGAVDFLIKPFQDQDLLDAIQAAIGRDGEKRRRVERETRRNIELICLNSDGQPQRR
jgi:FixJ family two-component response regulator